MLQWCLCSIILICFWILGGSKLLYLYQGHVLER